MNRKEFKELAKAFYEPMKQLDHIFKEMNIKEGITIYAGKGYVTVSGSAMPGWELRYNSLIDKWSAQQTTTLTPDFFLSIDEDLPYDPEDAA